VIKEKVGGYFEEKKRMGTGKTGKPLGNKPSRAPRRKEDGDSLGFNPENGL